MKIKTITCHDVYNYGASLQAYALQTFLEKLGHEVEIIDYLPDYKECRYDWFKIPSQSRLHAFSKVPGINKIFGLVCQRRSFKYYGRYKKFNAFKREYLHCTPMQYHNIEDLKNNPPLADLYIAGSDQIWNTKYINGTDPSYYCDFVDDKTKCISYAASFATSEIEPRWHNFVQEKLGNFSAISVRESTGESLAKSLGYEATTVLDPVFLLDKVEWNSLCQHERKGKYLIVYDFLRNDPRIKETCEKIANERNLKIYSLNDGGYTPWADMNIYDAGPIEFLEWIRGAEFVVSTSFHATAFSVIFQREFITFPLVGHKNSSRMEDFLSQFNLNSRFGGGKIYLQHKIDYEQILCLVRARQKQSRQWLINHIQKE